MRGNEFWLLPAESVGRGVRISGPVLVRGRGDVSIQDGAVLDAARAPIELNATEGARVEIGPGAYLGPGSSIEAGELVRVGAGAVVAPFAKILDNNWHGTGGARGERPTSTPVLVGAGARIGARATLVPGAALGEHSVLMDDSVLSRRVPPGMIVGGVPARPVGRVGPQEWEHDAGVDESAPTGDRPDGPLLLMPDWSGHVGLRTMLWLAGLECVERARLPREVRSTATKVERSITWLIALYQLRSAQEMHRSYAYGPIEVVNKGHLSLGDRVVFRGGPLRTRIGIANGARVAIGERSMVNYGAFFHAADSIEIGPRCLIGSRVLVVDEHEDMAGPVVIEESVWLANGATVLPGVRIGRGSAVSAGAVVDRDVPPGSLAVGSPVRFLPLTALTGHPE